MKIQGSAIVLAIAIAMATGACGEDVAPLSHEEMLDPAACQSCHPDHFAQWVGSSHAYAGDDPVFVAMNARYQRERGDQPADKCVRCHAPVAVAEGATADGMNLASIDPQLRGVTCYACHVVSEANAVLRTITLADDDVMRGAIEQPSETGAHGSAYSSLHDRDIWRSTDLCGSCHEFDNHLGLLPHRTYTEWTESIFANQTSSLFLSCGGCHTEGSDGPAAEGGPMRRVHDHKLVGLNVALLDWPEIDAQRVGIDADLEPAIFARVCLNAELQPEVTLDNVMGGHRFPSGDAYTRRMWVELIARTGDQAIYESGVVDNGVAVLTTRPADPDLWLVYDEITTDEGEPAVFSWQAAALESTTLPAATTTDPSDPAFYHAVTKTYAALPGIPDTMTMKVHIRPIGLDIIDELIDSGDLDAAVRARVPTFTPETAIIEWTGNVGDCVPKL